MGCGTSKVVISSDTNEPPIQLHPGEEPVLGKATKIENQNNSVDTKYQSANEITPALTMLSQNDGNFKSNNNLLKVKKHVFNI